MQQCHNAGAHSHMFLPCRGLATQQADQESADRQAALTVTWWGFGSNIGLAVLKYGAGVLSGSTALIADAAHSLSDLVSDFITLFVVHYAHLPPDKCYPYGRGRFETLGSLAVSVLLIGTAGGVGWDAMSVLVGYWSSGIAENMMLESGYGGLAIAACTVSLVTKEVLYHATARVGHKIKSPTLIANAWHHRSDAFSSIAALLGVGGSLAGMPLLDPLSGVLVSGLVAKAGIEIGWESVQEVAEGMDADDETLEAVRTAAAATEGVLGIEKLRARKMGPFSLVDLRIGVDPHITVSAARHVAERLRHKIVTSERHISDVLVHVHPFEQAEFDTSLRPHTQVEREVRDVLAQVPDVLGVEHVIVHYMPNGGLHLKVDIVCNEESTIKEAKAVARKAKHVLQELKGVTSVDIDLELRHV